MTSGIFQLPSMSDGGFSFGQYSRIIRMNPSFEAVRQLRGEAHPAVQVKNCDLALAHGTGGYLGTRHGSGTLIMERA